jgi:hypothetical protein
VNDYYLNQNLNFDSPYCKSLSSFNESKIIDEKLK